MNIKNAVRSILEALFYFAVYFCCQLAVSLGAVMLRVNVAEYTVHLSVLAAVITLAVYVIIFALQKKNIIHEVELKRASPLYCVLMPVFGAAVNVVMAIVLSLIPFPSAWMDEYNTAVSSIVEAHTAASVIFTVLLAPICEEIVMRGLVHTRLRRALPTFAAMIISSWIFGMMHGVKIQIIYAALLGLLLAWVFEKSGSLLAPILFHIGFNTCGLVINFYKGSPALLFLICAAISLFSIAYIQFTSKRKIDFVRKI